LKNFSFMLALKRFELNLFALNIKS